jgi:Na+-translocating ferredoxin:NAD+ oxidoreductase RnfC subunit
MGQKGKGEMRHEGQKKDGAKHTSLCDCIKCCDCFYHCHIGRLSVSILLQKNAGGFL